MKSNLISVDVCFTDSKFNYSTSVNGNQTDKQIAQYFLQNVFNMGNDRLMRPMSITIER